MCQVQLDVLHFGSDLPQLRFHFLQFRVRGIQLLVEINSGCSDEIVKGVGGSVEAFVERCMLVGYVKSVQAVDRRSDIHG
jgi:hypothetical protein